MPCKGLGSLEPANRCSTFSGETHNFLTCLSVGPIFFTNSQVLYIFPVPRVILAVARLMSVLRTRHSFSYLQSFRVHTATNPCVVVVMQLRLWDPSPLTW